MKINKFLTFGIVFIAIATCISFFDEFFRDFLNDSIIVLMFYIFGIIGVILAIMALRRHKRESNNFSIYSVSLVTFIVVTTLFLIVMPPCQCGSRQQARDARIVSDMYQLRSIAEASYNNNFYKDFEKDPVAIKTIDDIIEMKGTNLTINISPNGNQYCAEVLLNKKEWYCIDSALIAKEYNDNPKCSSDYFSCEDETVNLSSKALATEGWQTYRNVEYEFEFKYPEDWYIEVKKGKNGLLPEYSLVPPPGFASSSWTTLIEVILNEKKLNIDEDRPFISINTQTSGKRFFEIQYWEDFKTGQIDGKITCDESGCKIICFHPIDDREFYILTKNNPFSNELTDQILSTFRFLD